MVIWLNGFAMRCETFLSTNYLIYKTKARQIYSTSLFYFYMASLVIVLRPA